MNYTYLFTLDRVYKQISLLLIASILMWALGVPSWINSAKAAANLDDVSDTLSDSDLNVVSNHTVRFTTSSTGKLEAGENFTITFASGFVLPESLGVNDIDMTVDGGEQSLATSTGAGVWGVSVSTTTRVIQFNSQAVTGPNFSTSSDIIVEIGLHATGGGENGNDQITNPNSAQSYVISIGGTMDDSADLRIAIIDDVAMTASVNTSLTFTINPVDAGLSINGEGTTTSATSTATSMAFGTLVPNVPKVMSQRLTVATNALNGFTVTVHQDRNLTSASTADIDLFVDNDATSTPIAWVAPSANVTLENTWGHYGITTEDSSLSDGDSFGAFLYAGNIVTPREIFYHDGPADGTTAHVGETRIAIKMQISALQEAGNDYSNVLTYIATPIF